MLKRILLIYLLSAAGLFAELKVGDDAPTFFVRDLGIPQAQIPDFLDFVDAQLPSRTLLRRDREFELIDFLVDQSETFRKTVLQD